MEGSVCQENVKPPKSPFCHNFKNRKFSEFQNDNNFNSNPKFIRNSCLPKAANFPFKRWFNSKSSNNTFYPYKNNYHYRNNYNHFPNKRYYNRFNKFNYYRNNQNQANAYPQNYNSYKMQSNINAMHYCTNFKKPVYEKQLYSNRVGNFDYDRIKHNYNSTTQSCEVNFNKLKSNATNSQVNQFNVNSNQKHCKKHANFNATHQNYNNSIIQSNNLHQFKNFTSNYSMKDTETYSKDYSSNFPYRDDPNRNKLCSSKNDFSNSDERFATNPNLNFKTNYNHFNNNFKRSDHKINYPSNNQMQTNACQQHFKSYNMHSNINAISYHNEYNYPAYTKPSYSNKLRYGSNSTQNCVRDYYNPATKSCEVNHSNSNSNSDKTRMYNNCEIRQSNRLNINPNQKSYDAKSQDTRLIVSIKHSLNRIKKILLLISIIYRT